MRLADVVSFLLLCCVVIGCNLAALAIWFAGDWIHFRMQVRRRDARRADELVR